MRRGVSTTSASSFNIPKAEMQHGIACKKRSQSLPSLVPLKPMMSAPSSKSRKAPLSIRLDCLRPLELLKGSGADTHRIEGGVRPDGPRSRVPTPDADVRRSAGEPPAGTAHHLRRARNRRPRPAGRRAGAVASSWRSLWPGEAGGRAAPRRDGPGRGLADRAVRPAGSPPTDAENGNIRRRLLAIALDGLRAGGPSRCPAPGQPPRHYEARWTKAIPRARRG